MKFTNDEILKRQKIRKKRKKILSIIIYIIIIPLIIYNMALIIQSIVCSDKIPSFMGIKTFVIISGSMEPELKIGDIIIVQSVKEDDIKNNDIISFRDGANIVTHRIVDIKDENNEKSYVTKGDNNNIEDSHQVKFRDIEGKYTNKKIENFGNVVFFLQNKIVIISILAMFFILYIYDNNKKEKSRIRRNKREQYNLNYYSQIEDNLKIINNDSKK